MVRRRPLVTEDGLVSELLAGDTVQTGGSSTEVIAGSGLVGGGAIGPATRLDFAIAANPSGVIYAGDSIGNDGVSFVNATTALSSGNAALTDSVDAVASGNAALSVGTTALASGNAALDLLPTLGGGANTTIIEASSSVASGIPVGVDDTGRVRSIESFTASVTPAFQTGGSWTTYASASYSGTNAYPKLVCIAGQDTWVIIDRMDGSAYMRYQVYSWNGSSITAGTLTTAVSSNSQDIAQTYNEATDTIVQIHTNYGGGDATRMRTWYLSGGTTLAAADISTVSASSYAQRNFVISNTTNNTGMIGYSIGAGAVVLKPWTITAGTRQITKGNGKYSAFADFGASRGFYAANVDRYIILCNEGAQVTAQAFQITGTGGSASINDGTEVVVGATAGSSYRNFSLMKIGEDGDHVALYKDASNNMMARYGTLSGLTLTYSAAQNVMSMGTDIFMDVAWFPSQRAALLTIQQGNDAQTYNLVVDGSNNVSATAGVLCTAGGYNLQNFVASINTANTVAIGGNYNNTNLGAAVVSAGAIDGINPTLNSQTNVLGVADSTVASGTDCTVVLPGSVYNDSTAPYTPGKFYYADPTTSGLTETSTAPTSWSGAVPWNYLGKAVTTSGLLLINSL